MSEIRLHNQTIEEWFAIAATLYGELCKWGWGDFHYGHQAQQEESVRRALAVYERAIGAREGDMVIVVPPDGDARG